MSLNSRWSARGYAVNRRFLPTSAKMLPEVVVARGSARPKGLVPTGNHLLLGLMVKPS